MWFVRSWVRMWFVRSWVRMWFVRSWVRMWFVRSWVRLWFSQRKMDFLWKMEGKSFSLWPKFILA
jgi:hypothetical protein